MPPHPSRDVAIVVPRSSYDPGTDVGLIAVIVTLVVLLLFLFAITVIPFVRRWRKRRMEPKREPVTVEQFVGYRNANKPLSFQVHRQSPEFAGAQQRIQNLPRLVLPSIRDSFDSSYYYEEWEEKGETAEEYISHPHEAPQLPYLPSIATAPAASRTVGSAGTLESLSLASGPAPPQASSGPESCYSQDSPYAGTVPPVPVIQEPPASATVTRSNTQTVARLLKSRFRKDGEPQTPSETMLGGERSNRRPPASAGVWAEQRPPASARVPEAKPLPEDLSLPSPPSDSEIVISPAAFDLH